MRAQVLGFRVESFKLRTSDLGYLRLGLRFEGLWLGLKV